MITKLIHPTVQCTLYIHTWSQSSKAFQFCTYLTKWNIILGPSKLYRGYKNFLTRFCLYWLVSKKGSWGGLRRALTKQMWKHKVTIAYVVYTNSIETLPNGNVPMQQRHSETGIQMSETKLTAPFQIPKTYRYIWRLKCVKSGYSGKDVFTQNAEEAWNSW